MNAPLILAVLIAVAASAGAAAQDRSAKPPTNSCATAYNDICEDPALGGPPRCAPGTDRADCRGRLRYPREADALFGRDDRVLMDTSSFPWSVIGALRFDDGRGCSGSLVGERTVLTAAHCVLSQEGLAFDGAFVTARGHPAGPFTARIIDAHILDSLPEDAELDALLRENIDWALVQLDQPLGDQLGYLPMEVVRDNRPLRRDLISGLSLVLIAMLAAAATHGRTRQGLAALAVIAAIILAVFAYRTVFGYDPRGEQLWQAGYSWDTGPHLSGHAGCALLEFRPSGLIGHDCDTVNGDSGSPLLVRRGDAWAVIGVVSHSIRRIDRDAANRGEAWRDDRAYAASAARVPDPEAIFEDPR